MSLSSLGDEFEDLDTEEKLQYNEFGEHYLRSDLGGPMRSFLAVESAIATTSAKSSKEVSLSPEQLLICTHTVRGFSLKIKEWCKLISFRPLSH